MKIIIETKSQLLFLFIPILISMMWGFTSHYLNWDDKNLDAVFAVYPLIGASSIFCFGYLHYEGKQIGFLITGLIYIITLYISYIYNNLPIKVGDNLTIILFCFYGFLNFLSIIVYFFNRTRRIILTALIYNVMLISIIPFALLGYFVLVTNLLRLGYSFF